MATWKPIVGQSFQPDEFNDYCANLKWGIWRPSFIVLHNTGIPTLSQRPNGLTKEHILGLEKYYRDDQGWSAGPHLFVDDHQIWVFTPLTTQGVHSPSWNGVSWGVEMLGNYNQEAFETGRGAMVKANAVAAISILSNTIGLDPATMRLHKEDKHATHTDCPSHLVDKASFIAVVTAKMSHGQPLSHEKTSDLV